MRIVPFIMLFFVGTCLISCQKEYSLETNNNGPVAGSGYLIKATLKDDVSDVDFTYEYNASNQPSKNLIVARSAGFTAEYFSQPTRDGSGKIAFSKIVFKSPLNPGGDTINYEIFRNAAGRISHVLIKPADTTNTLGYDSVVYNYDASNKISNYFVMLIEYGSGLINPLQKFVLTYGGQNVIKSVEYELLGNLTNLRLVETLSFEYDNKPAARAFTDEEFIANLAPANNVMPSVNNTIKYTSKNEDDPDKDEIIEYKYEYGSNGKPITAVLTSTKPGLPSSKSNMAFFYK